MEFIKEFLTEPVTMLDIILMWIGYTIGAYISNRWL
jgi:hypothetical protein